MTKIYEKPVIVNKLTINENLQVLYESSGIFCLCTAFSGPFGLYV
jgi:hypothetical protein